MLWNCGVGEDSWESLGLKEIQSVNPKGNQSWIFIGRTDAEAKTLWPPDAKNWLIGKDPDAGKDWGQEEKGTTEEETVGWHHWLDGHEFEQAPGVGDGQRERPGVLQRWGCEGSGAAQLNWTAVPVQAYQVALAVKNPPANSGDVGNTQDRIFPPPAPPPHLWSVGSKPGSIPGSGRSPGGGHGHPLRYSCLENPMNRGACRATVHSFTESQTGLEQLSTCTILSVCIIYTNLLSILYWIIFRITYIRDQ